MRLYYALDNLQNLFCPKKCQVTPRMCVATLHLSAQVRTIDFVNWATAIILNICGFSWSRHRSGGFFPMSKKRFEGKKFPRRSHIKGRSRVAPLSVLDQFFSGKTQTTPVHHFFAWVTGRFRERMTLQKAPTDPPSPNKKCTGTWDSSIDPTCIA